MDECPPCRHACQNHMGLRTASSAQETASLLNSAEEEIRNGFLLKSLATSAASHWNSMRALCERLRPSLSFGGLSLGVIVSCAAGCEEPLQEDYQIALAFARPLLSYVPVVKLLHALLGSFQ